MFMIWGAPATRPTKDIDFLARTKNTIAGVVPIIRAVCTQQVEPDGLVFDDTTVEGALNQGRRRLRGHPGNVSGDASERPRIYAARSWIRRRGRSQPEDGRLSRDPRLARTAGPSLQPRDSRGGEIRGDS